MKEYKDKSFGVISTIIYMLIPIAIFSFILINNNKFETICLMILGYILWITMGITSLVTIRIRSGNLRIYSLFEFQRLIVKVENIVAIKFIRRYGKAASNDLIFTFIENNVTKQITISNILIEYEIDNLENYFDEIFFRHPNS